jgi:hypothetical protein
MDPFSIVGIAASVGQLADLSSRTALSAWSLLYTIIHAPAEVTQLATKLDRLTLMIEQVQKLNAEQSAANAEDLFPAAYRAILYNCLQSNADALQALKSLQPSQMTNSTTIKKRLHWALVDKRKARAILADLKDAKETLDVALSILGLWVFLCF